MLSMQKVKLHRSSKMVFNIIETPGLFFEKSLAPVWVEPKLVSVSGKIVYDKDEISYMRRIVVMEESVI